MKGSQAHKAPALFVKRIESDTGSALTHGKHASQPAAAHPVLYWYPKPTRLMCPYDETLARAWHATAQADRVRVGLLGHHDLDELLVVDLAVTVNVGLADH